MRYYSIVFAAVAVTAQQDLFYLAPATDKPIKLHALKIANGSEVGDAMEEMLRIAVIRNHTTVGSGGGSVTPRVTGDVADTASGATCRINDTAIASGGTAQTLDEDYWNVRIPYQWIWTPETRPNATAGDGRIVVRLLTTPADSITMSGTLYFEEH